MTSILAWLAYLVPIAGMGYLGYRGGLLIALGLTYGDLGAVAQWTAIIGCTALGAAAGWALSAAVSCLLS